MAARAERRGHHLRRLHRHAEDQDDGAVRHAARSRRSQPAPDNLPAPFHVYSMRQAIEEDFILDVLQNYTPYKLAFKLAHEGKEYRREGGRAQRGAEEDHGLGAAAPVQHRPEGRRSSSSTSARTWPRCSNGKAKAMVVVGSRWRRCAGKLAIDKYIKDRGYEIGTLVAFSGEVNDKESGPDPFTETQPDAEPQPARAATSAKPSRATSTRSCWWPTSSRPASISRCCAACTWTSGWPASRRCRRCRG